ncbi:hypothetical protein PR003_g13847 [Phytophthora rubi]|uniref:Uncharacterized protein n=1 Tax=Phytophthora rubi TaxID=129364 RepID=A0A6A3NBE3_9STRA|nr:hypothetical protein PR002_g13384 [Phytophthora rubi]KAE9039290.1 hypothetical protein PR001_g7566 [Phytophthora rubi]KAE9333802.1 hypothetical protein PR003_g13847 [Phytophthora rubi]
MSALPSPLVCFLGALRLHARHLRAPLWRSALGMVPRIPPCAVLFKVTCRKWKFCMCATRKYRGTGSVLVR